MHLSSPAFTDGGAIPEKHTCDGLNISPPLNWRGAPVGTKSFALICDDPDAPTQAWTHWVIYNLPATTTELPEHMPPAETLPNGAQQGTNDFKRPGYGGPCPPAGRTHHYRFKLLALDRVLQLPDPITKGALEKACAGHTLATATLTGTYRRG